MKYYRLSITKYRLDTVYLDNFAPVNLIRRAIFFTIYAICSALSGNLLYCFFRCVYFRRFKGGRALNKNLCIRGDLKADMNSYKMYIPLETAAIFFSSKSLSKTGY